LPAKIVQTPVRFFPAHGGVERYVLDLSRELLALGYKVTVVCADEPRAEITQFQSIKVIRLPYLGKVANTNITTRLWRTLMLQDFDLIHTHIPTPWSADVSALVSLLKHKPLVVTYHNDLVGQGLSGLVARAYNLTMLHLVLWRASAIIIAQAQYANFSHHLKWHRAKLVTIPVGVSEPAYESAGEREPGKVFFMSVLDRHHEYKGLGVLLEGMATVLSHYPNARLVVGGGGELVESYRRQAEGLGIAAHVEFLGIITDADLAFHYGSSSVFVLPSLNRLEGFGIVALEALSYGTPVITTPVTGSSEFVGRHGAGLVVDAGDPAQLASAIERLLENRAQAEMMGRRGAAAVLDEYGWPGIARQVADTYGM
jgi:glycosyltransferase involved in cell wall biosynthesis